MFQRLLPLLLVIAHAGLWLVSSKTLGRLEGPYPVHFDLTGQPDRFAEGGFWHLPLLGLGVSLLLVGAAVLVRRLAVTRPELVGLPRGRAWRGLPVDGRLRALRPASAMLFGLGLFVNLLLTSLVLDAYGVATRVAAEVSATKLLLAVGFMIVWLGLSLLRIRQAVGDEVRLARRGDPGAP